MGLMNNDLAIAINGYQLNDLKQAMSTINELRNSTDASTLSNAMVSKLMCNLACNN